MNKTRIHTTEISVLRNQYDSDGVLKNDNFQKFLHEGRIQALRVFDSELKTSDSESVEPMILWSEPEYQDEIRYPESMLIHTEFEPLSGPRYRIYQKLIRKSDGKILCFCNSFCILFDSSKKKPWKNASPLLAG
ncbi:acyl-CoA thioesterase [Leptospira gomenensis]|uniref:Acyl-CoA thioesterase n=1 Tax=Leptospira gomenensis TaxID=2484974 RepID=A0A5F1YEG9_9LEPT|nr:thioesterase family protein [Leptospira gomenensis]TGK37536.1 acyl-CoA thioesterase [Leptospira gomenensis]TGK39458.1 acyl-CoA thioesterase [Leptospira gomenensis]TGK43120.1 acyl-CoA thioesterase [Leptospira gomenensis]TGK55051.1 acyl-CoA thioesterase [Leptospira gomenensis]